MSMNEPRDRMDQPRVTMEGSEGDAHRARLSDPPRRTDDRAGWILPVTLAAVIVAGVVVFAMSRDRQTAGVAPDTTTGQSTQAPTPGAPKPPAPRP
jgi:hypothetical protein